MIESGLYYSKEHEWLRLEGGGTAAIGITDHAQEELGDIVYVELPAPDSAVGAGEAVGTVESVKAVSEIFCPVAGVVTEGNQALEASPERINADPYGDGWLFRIRFEDESALAPLLSAADYAEYLASEGG